MNEKLTLFLVIILFNSCSFFSSRNKNHEMPKHQKICLNQDSSRNKKCEAVVLCKDHCKKSRKASKKACYTKYNRGLCREDDLFCFKIMNTKYDECLAENKRQILYCSEECRVR